MRRGKVIFLATFITLISFTSGQGGSCLSCDSSQTPECATLNNEADLIQQCEEGQDYCFTRMNEGGHVIRGCGSGNVCQDLEPCTTCQGQSCNNGAYPPGRLQCHKCSGIQCENPLIGPVETCYIYNSEDLCYTVVETDEENEIVTHRGCISDENANMCEAQPEFCVTCTGNGCNNQPPSGTTDLSCIQCTEPDPACRYEYAEESGQPCGYNILLGRPERCYTHVDSDDRVTRGCLDDFRTLPQFQSDCDGTKDICQICETDNCNRDQVADPGRCVVCSSVLDSNCNLLTNTPTIEECPTGSHDKRGCFRMESGGEVSRGCVSSLSDENVEICQAGQDCKICLGDSCNRQVNFQTCYSCNSNEDQECIMPQTDEDPVSCSRYIENCLTYIDPESMRTIRGCQGDLQLPTGVTCPSDLCSECSGEACNSGIFPEGRRSCHRCYSTPECEQDLSVDSAFESVCEFYDAQDQCFSVLVQNIIHRGCLSDSSPGVQHCQDANENCLICNGQYCNSVAAFREASLNCVKCSDDDPACEWAYLIGSSEKCDGQVGLGEDESCYIYKDEDEKVMRGCSLEDPNVCQEDHCEFCIGDGCNNKAMAKQACIQCRSDRQGEETCAQQAEGINATQCENEEATFDTKGCFVQTLEDGAVWRGCATELSLRELEECKGDDEDNACRYCDGAACNDQPGGSSAFTASYLLLLVSSLCIILNFSY